VPPVGNIPDQRPNNDRSNLLRPPAVAPQLVLIYKSLVDFRDALIADLDHVWRWFGEPELALLPFRPRHRIHPRNLQDRFSQA